MRGVAFLCTAEFRPSSHRSDVPLLLLLLLLLFDEESMLLPCGNAGVGARPKTRAVAARDFLQPIQKHKG